MTTSDLVQLATASINASATIIAAAITAGATILAAFVAGIVAIVIARGKRNK